MRRWKAAALVSLVCSSLLSVWMCQEGLLLGHRLGPALAPLRRPPRTLDARLARLAQCKPRPQRGQGAGTGRDGPLSLGGAVSCSPGWPQTLAVDEDAPDVIPLASAS